MRQFIRHPVDVPIEIDTEDASPPSAFHTHDISRGGLAFLCAFAVMPGAHVQIRIPYVKPAFEARARVVWCRPHDADSYELGVTFLDADDAFLARMVEQVCHIEDYRKAVLRTEGRELSSEEAALEWIDKYASQFPEMGSGNLH
jgi:c-di-GMP-binding flagellar brake protein YcgR